MTTEISKELLLRAYRMMRRIRDLKNGSMSSSLLARSQDSFISTQVKKRRQPGSACTFEKKTTLQALTEATAIVLPKEWLSGA